MRNVLTFLIVPLAAFLAILCLGASPALAAGDSGGSPNPLEFRYDTALWAIVVFILLVVILWKTAWGPILDGLQKREQTILSSLEEAKKTRVEMEECQVKFKKELDEAYAKIPAMMEEARRDAEALKEQMRSEANSQIQAERQRLHREITLAKDQALQEIWNQSAQLATLISSKAIGRSMNEDDHRRLVQEAITEFARTPSNN